MTTRTLLVVAHVHAARAAGMRGNEHNHPGDRSIVIWWPARGIECIRGHQFSHVIVDSHVPRSVRRADWERLEHEIRTYCLRIEPMIWMAP